MIFRKVLKFSPFIVLTVLNLLALSMNAHAAKEGGTSGGGGDATTEMRVDEIRADILRWISQGGASGLTLPETVTYETYTSTMGKLLPTHAVVIGAVTLAEESSTQDEELKVVVNGQPKTCRGFVSQKDSLPHILCNAERFAATSQAEQYRLVHHEYAGLAGVEQNRGASSDYILSSQITGFLVPETILRLSVKPRRTKKESATGDTLDGAYKLLGAAVSGGVGCPTHVEVDSLRNAGISIREAGEGARWLLLIADRRLGRMNWMQETYSMPDICEGSFGEVTDSFIEKQSSGALVLTFHVTGYENGGCNDFTRAFHSNKKVTSRDVILAFNKDTEVMTYTLVEQTSPTRNNEISVCIMQKTTNH